MADWNDPSHVESLLNPKQWKFRSTTVRNVRLSCCVAGQIKVQNAGEDIQETMDMLVQEGLDPQSWDYAVIKNALLIGGTCSRLETIACSCKLKMLCVSWQIFIWLVVVGVKSGVGCPSLLLANICYAWIV